MDIKIDKAKKPFYKKWWFISIAFILSFPVWPFLLGSFLVYKIFKLNISKTIKYAIIVLILLPTLFIGSAWAAAIISPKPTREVKITDTQQPPSPSPSPFPSTTPGASQPPTEEIQSSNTVSTSSPLVVGLQREKIKVKRVIDGDTIELENGQKVRYIGIDTPETVHPSKPVQCFGKEASTKNKELVEGKTVELEKDVSETDKYGRLLRYVWIGDVLVNEVLVREGYAQSSTYPPDVKYQERFLEAQKLAREENKGLWSSYCNNWNYSPSPSPQINLEVATPPPQTTGSYTCNCSKSCDEISSCEEAYFQLNSCGCSKRDGDKDGIPCESLCQ